MIRPLARVAALVVGVPYLLLASTLAPQHVHEPGPGEDHDHLIAHSHFGPHTAEAHHADGIEIERDQARVVWLDTSILNEHSYQAFPVPVAVGGVVSTVVTARSWSSIPSERSAPAHGPPKALRPFRGPPAFLSSLI